jgi:hypothetical protein
MPRGLERFLNHRTAASRRTSLGRVVSVTRETWKLSDDPKAVAPKVQVVATRRSAADAADAWENLTHPFAPASPPPQNRR